ncbi:hypothetical protein CBS101457_004975 [Exobasidium rhododendri]|nr:hypothetical protein CBS101457_004975 [Exobasidium rhododendri]
MLVVYKKSTLALMHYGDLTVTNYPVNSAGYVTDSDYYGDSSPPDGACYCDIYSQYSPDGTTLTPLGYYSLGTPAQPAKCNSGDIVVPKADGSAGDPGSEVYCEVVRVGGEYRMIENMCKCGNSTATPTTGPPINSTSPQINNTPNQALINKVMAEAHGQTSSSSSSSSSTISRSSTSSHGGSSTTSIGGASTSGSTSQATLHMPQITCCFILAASLVLSGVIWL